MTALEETRTDPLTGALSRASLDACLAAHISTALRTASPLALCVVDLDHFKSINDAFGHTRGDQALAETAARLRTALRHSDLLFRFGGDEFVLLLPDADLAHAAALADRLLAAVSHTPLPGQPPITLSLSIGVAALDADTTSPEALFARADARAGAAKRRGRGQVVSADAPTSARLRFDDSTRLLERDSALAGIRAFLAGLSQQGRGVLTIAGVPGSGRSRLLAETKRLAALQGIAVLHLAGSAGLRTRRYGALGLAGIDVRALESAGGAPEAMAAALLDQVQEGRRGLLVAVDDTDEVDHGTLALLQAMAAMPANVPVGLALVAGVGGAARVHCLAPLTARVETAPLSSEAIGIWLRGILAWEPPPELVVWLAERSAGRPAHVRRLLEQLERRGALQATADGWNLPDGAAAPQLSVVAIERMGTVRLPAFPGAFIGRAEEIQRLKDMLDTARLVSLIGPGGAGKTRLAVQAAAECAAHYADGVVFVALAGLDDPARLPSALTAALELSVGAREEPRVKLIDYLRERRLLLVLDNLETLIDGLEMLRDILAAGPGVAVLATSREPLHLPGEMALALEGLRTEDGAGVSAAEQLLLQRTVERSPGWQPDVAERQAVARICRAVDGLPLGLELAATWIPVLGAVALAESMAGNAALLDLPAGSRLQPALAYFWSTLGTGEQRILRGLTVFRGGFTQAAARQVAGASPFLLAALTDRAFLRRQESGRYLVHELLRQYGQARLAQRPKEQQRVRARHAASCLALAEEAEPHLERQDQALWLQRLETEHDNLRAALAWTIHERGDTALGLNLAGTLHRFWWRRGHLREGRQWIAEALAAAPDADPTITARARRGAGQLAWNQSDYAEARAAYEAALPLYQQSGDRLGEAQLLGNMGLVAQEQGNYAESLRLHERSLNLARQVEDVLAIARALGNLGVVSDNMGELPRAAGYYQEALTFSRQMGDLRGEAISLCNLGSLAGRQQRHEEAILLLEEALAIFRGMDDKRGIAFTLTDLAQELLSGGAAAVERVMPVMRESLALEQELGNKRGVYSCLLSMVDVASTQQDWRRAVQFAGAAAALQAAIGAATPLSEQEGYARDMAALRAALGEEAYAAAWTAGQAMSMEQAIAFAAAP